MPTEEKDMKTRRIYDKSGTLIGSIVGRRSEIDRFSNHDLAKQVEVDIRKQKENQERKY